MGKGWVDKKTEFVVCVCVCVSEGKLDDEVW